MCLICCVKRCTATNVTLVVDRLERITHYFTALIHFPPQILLHEIKLQLFGKQRKRPCVTPKGNTVTLRLKVPAGKLARCLSAGCGL